jgi:hypothetical protein
MPDIYLQLNDLILPKKGEEALISSPHVIVYLDAGTDRAFAMNMMKDIKPTRLSYKALILELELGELVKGQLQLPDYMERPDRFINSEQIEKRNKKFEVIKPILENLESFLVSRSYGSELVKKCLDVARVVDVKANRTQLYEWLYRYFRAGCNINGFLRKTGTGQVTNKKYSGKTGPKRGTKVVGRMRTEADNKKIKAIVNKHIKCGSPKSFPEAFVEYEDAYASDPVVDGITGEIIRHKRWDEGLRISEGQFTAFGRSYMNKNIEKFRDSQGTTDKFAKDQKGLSGDVEEFYADAPGQSYMIDETPLAIELVDEFDPTRTKRMGRPTCYSVMDMFSRTWVALLLTFAKASAHTAREVIFVAFRNKAQFCKEIGVNLTEQWDVQGKCRAIIVDNAEFKAELERAFSKDAQIEQIYNTEGNSQQKGLVERRHKSLEDFLFGMVPGVGRKNVADYVKRNLRKDALINIRELYQILIDFITRYNNYYPLEGLPLTKQMRLDGVKPIPMSKWDWGMKNRPGYLKPVNDEELYRTLLEVGEITVHRGYLMLPGRFLKRRKGKNSKGLKYKCEWTYKNGIQDLKVGQKELPRLSCRFMRYSVGQIFIETPEGFKPAFLAQVDDMYSNMSDESVKYDKEEVYVNNKLLKTTYDEVQSETRIKVSNIISQAKVEQIPINANEANSQDISANREEAIDREINLSQTQFNEYVGESPNSFEGDGSDNEQKENMDTNVVEEANATASIFAAKMASSRSTRSRRGKE